MLSFYQTKSEAWFYEFLNTILQDIKQEALCGSKQTEIIAENIVNSLVDEFKKYQIFSGTIKENEEVYVHEFIAPELIDGVIRNVNEITIDLHKTLRLNFGQQIDKITTEIVTKLLD